MKREERLVSLQKSLDDDTILTTQLRITFNRVIPILHMKTTILDSTIHLKVTNRKSDVSNTVNNIITDPLDRDRFIFINRANSLVTNSNIHLYYDKKYEDIIIIPDTLTYDSGEDTNINKNRIFDIYGSIVGGVTKHNTGKLSNEHLGLTIEESSFIYPIPITKDNIETTTKKAQLKGLQSPVSTNDIEYGLTNDDNVFLNYKAAPSITFIDLGDHTNLFENIPTIPLSSIIQNGVNNYTTVNNNNTQPEDDYSLLIAIEF